MLRTGDQIGPYVLVRKLGRGAFGFVWLAERKTVIATTLVALKIPIDDEIDIATVSAEAALWVNASGHPNVLPIIEANLYDDLIVLVSEYAPDGSLADWLKQNGGVAPSIAMAVDMVIGVLSGLEHLHSRRIIHRDLKPPNILLQGQKPRLSDFGVSRILKTTGHSSIVAGTPQYMAPEAFSGIRNEQTDLWSAGVILYQLLSGRLPFPQTDIAALAVSIQNTPLSPLPSSVPEHLQRVVVNALQKNPGLRYRSAAEMREALSGIPPHGPAVRYETTPIVSDVHPNPGGSTELITNPMVSPSNPPAGTRPAPVMYGTAPALESDQLRKTPVRVELAQQPMPDGALLKSTADKKNAILIYVILSTAGWSIGLGIWGLFLEKTTGPGIWFLFTQTLNIYLQVEIALFSVAAVTILITAQFVALRQFIKITFLKWWGATCASLLLFFWLRFVTGSLFQLPAFPWLQIICGISGVLMGTMQWLVFRKHVTKAWLWIAGTTAAVIALVAVLHPLSHAIYQLLSLIPFYSSRGAIYPTSVGIILGACFGVGQALSLLGFRTKSGSVESGQPSAKEMSSSR